MINSGDTAFVLLSAALVALMTPGLAFFYGGLVKRKHVLTIMMQSFIAMGLISFFWLLFSFSLAFGGDVGSVIGNFDYALLRNVGMEPVEGFGDIPFYAFFAFQMMFAIIAPALMTGAFVDRMRFKAYLIFLVLWSILVYAPIAHWVWGGGFMSDWGALDFAGGLVIHISAGFGALASIFVLGKRRHSNHEFHNLPYVALGTALLWFGWFGFNSGSALGANAQAALAFVNTDIAASAAMVGWLFLSWFHSGKPSMVGALTGAIAGLVAVTPAAGFVEPWSALIIGLVASIVCYYAVQFRIRTKWDDALDVWAVHGMGGVVGAILTGVFAVERLGGTSGLIEGSGAAFLANFYSTIVAGSFAFIMTYLILKFIGLFMNLKISVYELEQGLDKAMHGEDAYDF
ncbi:ammonium transporter [Candidatus Peregrinibacteria bacterium]|jgi:ammonium transporter, Amt family|nr:ammonium transporter [Candidatus Peregrinibacteria bacterium]MBT4632282.1 ammonium transporter [Candidatus Peregrinibacteria bacterium]MBT5516823.1 ammonium transporter [Candidatus Peregrinibacteria bacterium]MBT5824307.1 ammonium transporter [Candidatus Peregrinibacteria bacterium]